MQIFINRLLGDRECLLNKLCDSIEYLLAIQKITPCCNKNKEQRKNRKKSIVG